MRMFVCFALAAVPVTASDAAKAYVGTLRLNSSDTSPSTDNVLPFFRFLSPGDEGSVGIDLPLGHLPNGLKPRPATLGNTLPDYLIDPQHGLPDTLGKVLPWRLKDGWTSSRKPTDVKVATLENEHLRVDVMPLWGGHVHRALHKRSGRHLCFYNEEHQPVNDGEARAMTLGGIQWNWLPNQLGHAVFTQNPVYVAKMQTERGDALRVWEFDRLEWYHMAARPTPAWRGIVGTRAGDQSNSDRHQGLLVDRSPDAHDIADGTDANDRWKRATQAM